MSFSLTDSYSSLRRNIITILGTVLLGVLLGQAIQILGNLSLRWFVGVLACFTLILAVSIVGRPRAIFLSILILSIPLSFDYHLIYRPGHMGVSDGIAIGVMHVCLVILTVIWVYQVRSGEIHIDTFPSITVPILVMLLAALLSVFNSSDKALSLYGIVRSIEALAFCFYLANNLKTKRDLNLALVVLQLCVVIHGGVCIAEAVTGINFTTSFNVFLEEPSTAFRSAGLTGSPTYAGGYLAAVLPLVFIQLFTIEKTMGKILTLIVCVIGMTGLFLTLTRAAWLAAAAASIPVMFILLRYRVIKMRHVVLSILLVITFVFLFRGSIFSRLSEGWLNVKNRIHLIHTAANMVKAHPIIGIGINTYDEEMDKYVPSDLAYEWMYVVHNKYMLLWSETGPLGLLGFLWVLAAALRRVLRLTGSRDPLISRAAIALFGSLMVISIHMLFESYGGGPPLLQFWLIIGMIMGLSKALELDRPLHPRSHKVSQ